MGRLTKDAELSQTPNGINLARFSIAVNRRFAKDGQQQADFINCIAWRKTGEFIAKYFHKGSMIALVGSIQSHSWDGQDGKKKYSTGVVVDEAYFTGETSKRINQTSPAQNYSQQSKQEHMFDDDFYSGFSDLDGSEDDLPF